MCRARGSSSTFAPEAPTPALPTALGLRIPPDPTPRDPRPLREGTRPAGGRDGQPRARRREAGAALKVTLLGGGSRRSGTRHDTTHDTPRHTAPRHATPRVSSEITVFRGAGGGQRPRRPASPVPRAAAPALTTMQGLGVAMERGRAGGGCGRLGAAGAGSGSDRSGGCSGQWEREAPRPQRPRHRLRAPRAPRPQHGRDGAALRTAVQRPGVRRPARGTGERGHITGAVLSVGLSPSQQGVGVPVLSHVPTPGS